MNFSLLHLILYVDAILCFYAGWLYLSLCILLFFIEIRLQHCLSYYISIFPYRIIRYIQFWWKKTLDIFPPQTDLLWPQLIRKYSFINNGKETLYLIFSKYIELCNVIHLSNNWIRTLSITHTQFRYTHSYIRKFEVSGNIFLFRIVNKF